MVVLSITPQPATDSSATAQEAVLNWRHNFGPRPPIQVIDELESLSNREVLSPADKHVLAEAQMGGLIQTRHRTQDLLTSAASEGYVPAQVAVLVEIVKLEGDPHRKSEAFEKLLDLASQGSFLAAKQVGDAYLQGRFPVEKDLVEAEYWLLRAAYQGSLQAHFSLAILYDMQGNKKLWGEAIANAAEAGDPRAIKVIEEGE